MFGAGGARQPENGERLVHCLRPGMELVVSPHKSVAELGVIGRAEDMHLVLDAERDATMAPWTRSYTSRVGGGAGRRYGCRPTASRGPCPATPLPGPATLKSTNTSW